MAHPFSTLDVFTSTPFAGNPLALVRLPPASTPSLTTERMQLVAREFNLSETLFLHARESDDIPEWRVRIFVTDAELPFAGHPTIGAACYVLRNLAPEARRVRLVCNAGPIDVERAGDGARARVPMDFHHHTENAVDARGVAGQLQPALAGGRGLKGVDMVSPVRGMNFALVELEGVDVLGQSGTGGAGVDGLMALDGGWDFGLKAAYYYVVLGGTEAETVKIRSRMLMGSLEDPATGSAASGLGAFLALRLGKERVRFEILQGVEMGRESAIGVSVVLDEQRKGVKELYLEGTAVEVMEGTIRC